MTDSLKERIRAAARDLGFVRAGFCDVTPLSRGREALSRWLAAGMHGEMAYMAREEPARWDPRALLPEARCALVVVARYGEGDGSGTGRGTDDEAAGQIARYAWGADYHSVLKRRLFALVERLAGWLGHAPAHRVCVDSAPVLERELAARAGVGFIGKNSMLISPGVGAYTVLGVVLLDLELDPDEPTPPRCGTCTLCLDACPTDALVAPYVLDARRCVSYLTIEHRGDIDEQLAARAGDWVFGCDDCNDVCPFNAPTPASRALPRDVELAGDPDEGARPLADLLALRSGDYRRLTRGRAIARAPRRALMRNAAHAAGNAEALDDPAASRLDAACHSDEPLVRTAARAASARRQQRPNGGGAGAS